MPTLAKDWDRYVVHAEDVARGDGFRNLRDRIIELAAPESGETAVDVGSGTGLLTLALAERVSRVWAIDISPQMCEYLKTKVASAGHRNVEAAVASATSLPLVDGAADVVVSNYCFHHLADHDKERALAEVERVLKPGGRFVFGDMMFRVSVAGRRDRQVVAGKIRRMASQGPAGIWRLLKNAVRFAGRRWEKPARAGWWEAALARAGFVDVEVNVMAHEGGIGSARKPPA